MPVHGPRQIVSSTTAPDMAGAGGVDAKTPSLQIFVPDIATVRLQLVWAVRFAWRAPVENFEITDIDVMPSTITLSNFAGNADNTEFTVDMTLPDGIWIQRKSVSMRVPLISRR